MVNIVRVVPHIDLHVGDFCADNRVRLVGRKLLIHEPIFWYSLIINNFSSSFGNADRKETDKNLGTRLLLILYFVLVLRARIIPWACEN